MSVQPAPRALALAAYRTPPYAVKVDLRLDGNEGPPPPADLVSAACPDARSVAWRYPDRGALREALADRHQVSPEQILVTAGGDDALDRALRAMLCAGRQCVLPGPTFEMLRRYATWADGEVLDVPWPDGPFPTDAVLAAITPQTRVLCIVSPNNPTGCVATLEDIQRLSAAAPEALLVVDLAYVEFAEVDPTAEILRLPNAVVFRTLSKAWGLAGLRIGYALGPPEILGWMRAVGNPYTVAGPSAAIALRRLQTGAFEVDRFIDQVKQERTELAATLRDLGWSVPESQGNFVFARSPLAPFLRSALASAGIGVRGWPGHPELGDAVRITLPGNSEAFGRLMDALMSALSPEALLFDMDGVLADVSRSYRTAIIETAAGFGVTITGDDIRAAKAGGNANDDWKLTRRLLAERGVELDQAVVTEAFEALYQGTDGPGLKATERCRIDRDALARLPYPKAIVTGRPRRDALEFLERFELTDLFSVIVCMEDAPSKPDPAPVLLALRQLGCNRAWMLGDTPDDLTAARRAGVVPIGIVAPGEDNVDTLTGAGAASVLTTPTALQELLP